jgi:F-type H+-transporting ATPase subunit delta
MAELVTLARPYAKAAFAVALDATAYTKGLTHWQDMLNTLAAVVGQPKMQAALDRPELTCEQQAQLLLSVCGDALDSKAQNFVRVLAGNKRMSLLPEIALQFAELKAHQEKTVAVDVRSAFALDATQAASLAQVLGRRWRCQVELSTEVDASLLGGLVIKAGDTVIDASVRGRLHKLADALNV